MSCVDPVSGEIYAIEHREGQASLYVYIYPLKTLMNLCVDVIAKSPLLCQTVPLLPGDLRVRFTYLHYYNN